MTRYLDNAIAPGKDNVAGLEYLEEISVDGRLFSYVDDLSGYNPGLRYINGLGIGVVYGSESTVWISPSITMAQYLYIKTTILGGFYSGGVTINTRLEDPDTYVNRNAVLTIPFYAETTVKILNLPPFEWTYAELEVVP